MTTKWDRHFMALARMSANMSKDPKRAVGAVIVDSLRRQVGSGYNGFPRGVRDDPERYLDKMVKLKMVVHAEANAILNSVTRINGCTLYSTTFPCSECAKLIIQTGIAKVVTTPTNDFSEDDLQDTYFSIQMFREAGVSVMHEDGMIVTDPCEMPP